MGWLEFVLLGLLALWLAGSLVWMLRRKKRGGCSGCSGCCAACNRKCK